MEPETAAPAESGPLSIEQAAAAIGGQVEAPEAQQPEAAAEEPQSEATSEAEDTPEPEEAIAGEEEQAPESEPEAPAIAAPVSWTAEERARFATLPRETQEFLANRESERDRAVSKAQQEAAESRKAAGDIQTWKAGLDDVLAKAQQTFAGKWDGIDWAAFARQDPEAYIVAKAEFDVEQQELQRVHTAQQQAEHVAFQNHWTEVKAQLPTVAPDLADPKDGVDRVSRVERFLLDSKTATPADLRWVTAEQLSIAYDAMRFREAQASLASNPKPAPKTPAQVRPTVKPTAAQPAASSPQQRASAAYARLSKSGSIEDAVAYLNLKGSVQ